MVKEVPLIIECTNGMMGGPAYHRLQYPACISKRAIGIITNGIT
jgi:hypothetical protein